jgi:hypothetical protein
MSIITDLEEILYATTWPYVYKSVADAIYQINVCDSVIVPAYSKLDTVVGVREYKLSSIFDTIVGFKVTESPPNLKVSLWNGDKKLCDCSCTESYAKLPGIFPIASIMYPDIYVHVDCDADTFGDLYVISGVVDKSHRDGLYTRRIDLPKFKCQMWKGVLFII